MSGMVRLDGFGVRKLVRGRHVTIERAGLPDVRGRYLLSDVLGANDFVIVIRRDEDGRKQMYGAHGSTVWVDPTAAPPSPPAHMYWPMVTMIIILIAPITPSPLWLALAVWFLNR